MTNYKRFIKDPDDPSIADINLAPYHTIFRCQVANKLDPIQFVVLNSERLTPKRITQLQRLEHSFLTGEPVSFEAGGVKYTDITAYKMEKHAIALIQ